MVTNTNLKYADSSMIYYVIMMVQTVAVAGSDQPGAGAGLRLSPGACFALCSKEQCFYITNIQLDGNHP